MTTPREMSASVYARTTFVGWHRWKDAPESVAYLRDWHRHVFHVRVGVPVSHGNRQVEFITLKEELDKFLAAAYAGRRFEESCEQIAEGVAKKFDAVFAEVSEDGENGAFLVAKTPAEAPKSQKTVSQKLAEEIDRMVFTGGKFSFGSGTGPKFAPMEYPPVSLEVMENRERIANKNTFRIFYGFEVEGPKADQDRPTMFVPGSTAPEAFKNAWDHLMAEAKLASVVPCVLELEDRLQVYVGAGNDYEAVREDLVREVLKVFSPANVTVEVASIPSAPWVFTVPGMNLVRLVSRSVQSFTTYCKAVGPALLYHKYVDVKAGTITWLSVARAVAHKSLLDDHRFQEDTGHAHKFVRKVCEACKPS